MRGSACEFTQVGSDNRGARDVHRRHVGFERNFYDVGPDGRRSVRSSSGERQRAVAAGLAIDSVRTSQR